MFIYTIGDILAAAFWLMFVLFCVFVICYSKFDDWRRERRRKRMLQKEQA